MAKPDAVITVGFKFKVSFWDAIKMRLAGTSATVIAEMIVKQMEESRQSLKEIKIDAA